MPQFSKHPVNFGNAKGFAFYPLDMDTNYKRIVMLDKSVLAEGEVAGPDHVPNDCFMFEYFVGFETLEAHPVRVSKKRNIGSEKDVYPVEEWVKTMRYMSPPVNDPSAVTNMRTWLNLNTVA